MFKQEERKGTGRAPSPSFDHSPPSGFLDQSAGLLSRVVFACLLALIALSTIPYGTVDPWWEAAFECAVFALTAVWLLEVLLRGSWQADKLIVLLPMVALTAFAFLQTVSWPRGFWDLTKGSPTALNSLTVDQYQTHLTAVKMLALTLLMVLLLQHVSSRRRLQWLVRLVLIVGLGSSLFAIGRQLMQSPDSTSGFGLPFLYPGVGYGQFLSQNVFAFLAEMTLGLVMGLVLGGGIRRQHILIYSSAALIIWAALVLSYSRGAILGLVCQSLFLLFVALSWFLRKKLGRDYESGQSVIVSIQSSPFFRIFAILLIVIALVAGVFWMGGQRLASRIEENNNFAGASIDGITRKEIWRSTWGLIKNNPWTGVGFGAYYLAIPQYQVGSGRIKVEQAHNDYLDLAASGGIIALILAALFIGVVVWRARLSLRSSDAYRRAAALGAMAGLLSVSVHSLVDFGLQITGIAVIALTLVAISVAKTTPQSE